MTDEGQVAGVIIIDGKPVNAETVTGKVLKLRGKYFLQVRGKKLAIPLSPVTPETQVAKLVRKTVDVALSKQPKPSVVAIGTWPTPERPHVRRIGPIICYIPVPDLRRGLDSKVQEMLLHEMAAR